MQHKVKRKNKNTKKKRETDIHKKDREYWTLSYSASRQMQIAVGFRTPLQFLLRLYFHHLNNVSLMFYLFIDIVDVVDVTL